MRKELHWGWWWLAITVAACTIMGTVAQGQTPPPVNHLSYSRQVSHVLDSLANDARTNRIENAVCLVGYSVTDSTLTLERVGPAVYVKADSVTIRAFSPICPPGVPSIHSHVSFNGWPHPSDADLLTEKTRGIWSLILSVHDTGYFLVVY